MSGCYCKRFWGSCHQRTFLMLRCLTHMHACSELQPVALIYLQTYMEREKQTGKYEQRICEVEIGCFTTSLLEGCTFLRLSIPTC